MALVVRLFKLTPEGVDEEIGRLVWDGKRIVPKPNAKTLRRVLNEPIEVHENRKVREVEAHEDPEAFLRGLYLHYKSAYFRASRAAEEK